MNNLEKIYKKFQPKLISYILSNQNKFYNILETNYNLIKSNYISGIMHYDFDNNIRFIFNLEHETIEVFVNKQLIKKELMSLPILKLLVGIYKQNCFTDDKNLDKFYEKSSLKYLVELASIGINTKYLFKN